MQLKDTKEEQKTISEESSKFVLNKKNYIVLAAGFVVLLIGYILLSGGKSEDVSVFNAEIFNFRRITLAPIVLFIGFCIEIFAIMWKPRSK